GIVHGGIVLKRDAYCLRFGLKTEPRRTRRTRRKASLRLFLRVLPVLRGSIFPQTPIGLRNQRKRSVAMRCLRMTVLALALPIVSLAHEADPAYLATLHNEGTLLPRGLAPFESVPHYVPPLAPADAPGGHVRAIAEYEP